MNKQQEALKLALEALESVKHKIDSYQVNVCDDVDEAITAIREALADSALDRMAENARELGIQMQPEQKPIARLQWADGWTVTLLTGAEDIPSRSGPYALYVGPAPEQPAQQQEPVCDKDPQGCWSVRCQLGKVCKNTSPPASKPWVGLTQQDIDIAFDDTQEGGGFNEFARAIEAKLREKNNG